MSDERSEATQPAQQSEARPWPRMSWLRRVGPTVLVVAALVAAGVVATRQHGTPAPQGNQSAVNATARGTLPITYQMAERSGTVSKYHWGPGCDPKTGRLKMPSIYAFPCIPEFHGANSGASAPGVTSSTITVAYYVAPPGDLASAIEGATGSPATNLATAQKYVAMLNAIVPLFGRHVVLVPFDATGTSNDAVAAQADALTVADQLHAFASIGGPSQTTAYQAELARLHVLCISCALSSSQTNFVQDAPYLWGLLPTPDTVLSESFRYVVTHLMHHDAIYAGEASMHNRTRAFAFVHYDQSPPVFSSITKELDRQIAGSGLSFVSNDDYLLDLSELPDEAATIAEKLKASGATTVIFAGDPIMPIYLTEQCAAIGYFPEWVITGTVFTNTSTLGRYYNQKEWAHAFGISTLGVPTPIAQGDAYRLYRWYYGGTPAAAKTAGVILPPLQTLYEGLELAGPDLSGATYQAGMFRLPEAGGGPTAPRAAYGANGSWPHPSYATPSDYTFIWYDATATGTDEEGVYGSGMMRYVNGGKRYVSTSGPSGAVPMFQLKGSVLQYQTTPPSGTPPSYPPWPGSPEATAG